MKKKALSMILMIVMVFTILATAQADFNETYYKVRFDGSFPVYSGPGTGYYRGGGNATYGGGVARYYGTASNNWLFIGYETSKGLWRMGYVKPDAASAIKTSPDNYKLFNISFQNTAGQVTYDTYITDDPLYGDKTPLVKVKTGQLITVKGVWNSYWTYVEAQVGSKLVRGFIKSDAVDTSGVPIYTPTPVPTATPVPTPVPTAGPTPVPTPIPTAVITPQPTAIPVTGKPYLTNLTHNAPNTGRMVPSSFSPTQTSYLLTVADWVSRIYFTPQAGPNITIYVNGQIIASGSRSQTITLSDKPTSVDIHLAGTYGQTNNYTVYIQRRPSERRTRVSAGYIESMYTSNSKNYIRADLVTVTYTPGTNLSTFSNQTYYLYNYACADNCVFYYGTMNNIIRAASFNDFLANYKMYGSTLYRIIYIEDEIVAVMPYDGDYATLQGVGTPGD